MRIVFDFSDFDRAAARMGALADQIPFALARSLNDAAEVARRELADTTWPQHVTARNRSFLKAALTTSGTRATKRNLRVEVYDRFGRGNLKLHETGGTLRSRGSNLAIPTDKIKGRRSGRGVPRGLRPRNLPNSFVTDGRRPNTHLKQNAIYQRQGSYHRTGSIISRTGKTRKASADGRTVKLMYTLKPSVSVPATVPFHSDFARIMGREVSRAFGRNLQAAMRTAFRR